MTSTSNYSAATSSPYSVPCRTGHGGPSIPRDACARGHPAKRSPPTSTTSGAGPRRTGRGVPITTLGRVTANGIPYLAPDVQLFYKAKNPRPKDETDLAAVLPTLTDDRRQWLADAITRTYGRHPWPDRLRRGLLP